MSEPFIERLNRFTPNAGGLDRDALLYAAGRASARPNRAWIALATALALAQPLSLVLLWPHPVPPATRVRVDVASLPTPSATVESPAPDASEGAGLWSAGSSLSELEAAKSPVPAQAVRFIESGPPLRAFGPPPPSILN
jgi:hypothetical protein